MRVALALFAVLIVGAACTAAQGGSENVTLTTIARGAYAASKDGRNAALATTDTDYRRLWSQLIGSGDPPAADFGSGVVVFLLAGQRNTGGWSVEPQSVTMEGSTAVITAVVQAPPADAMVTQALTYPYAVVAINSRDVTNVRWPQ